MKKILGALLGVCMLFTTTGIAFANSSFETVNDNMKDKTINLLISKDESELEMMRKNNGDLIKTYSEEKNAIQMHLHKDYSENEIVFITGSGSVLIDGIRYDFSFNKSPLCEALVGKKVLYDGVIETVLSSEAAEKEAYIDLMCADDFSKAVISLTVKEENGDQAFLLYGEPFTEQIELSENISKAYTYALNNKVEQHEYNNDGESLLISSSKSYLQHVTNKSDSSLDGVERNKQMVVMSVGKYDPKNSGELNGMENIRVFSRAYNVTQFVDGGIQAIPFKVHANFTANRNASGASFLEITATEPNNGSNEMQKYFDIFVSIIGGVPGGEKVGTIALIFEKFIAGNVTLTKNGQSYNSKVQFSHQVYKTTDLNYSASVNLPASAKSSDAEDEENKNYGVNFTIHYTQRATTDSAASAICSASVDYRVLLNGATRFVTVSSGTASITHTLNAK